MTQFSSDRLYAKLLPITQDPEAMTPTIIACDPEMDLGTSELREILSWQRPHQTNAELEFIGKYVDDLKALYPIERDDFGNRWITIGDGSSGLLFSCHIDTMAAKGGRQEVCYLPDGKTIALRKQKPGRVLGADDGAGLWLLREMIRARVEGTYVFHRGEECGRLGSKHVWKYEAHRLVGFQACIAFDRKGTDNLITHQSAERGVSDAFARSLADALYVASSGKLQYVNDSSGSYTDSFTYFDTIPECTNLSVGYEREHSSRETLDASHVWSLRNALIAADWSSLVIERDPYAMPVYDGDDWSYGSASGGGGWDIDAATGYPQYDVRSGDSSRWEDDPQSYDLMAALCKQYPYAAAQMMQEVGLTLDDFAEMIGPSQVTLARSIGS